MPEMCHGVKIDRSVIGEKYGRLVVTGAMFHARRNFSCDPRKASLVVCVCDCGVVGIYRMGNLRSGNSNSCGCLNLELCKSRHLTHGGARRNKNHDPEYLVWNTMIQRCTNQNTVAWKDYGGRGIKVCERWASSYQDFIEDMGRRPTKDHTIDRVDTNGDYCPENCRWATWKQQQRNRRNNRRVTVDGETKVLAEWSEIYGVDIKRISARLKRGWDAERAVKTPSNK